MEERSNKTIISSVLFLDIVEYSKKSVTGQISLKDRFNTYLSEAIYDVPATDRIILDTGDGAAVNFMGDVEAALSAALRLRASLLAEDPYLEPQLLVRIGINLGPVRLVRDINGQPNIVGDGINVAQRVMAFADPSQILVSRSYYDAVSRLSAEYTGMFHYQGSRTDKHVREHEIYAIGYPGDQTTKKLSIKDGEAPKGYSNTLVRAKTVLFSVIPDSGVWTEKISQASTKQRVLYASLVVVPLLLLGSVLALMPGKHPVSESKTPVETMPSASAVPSVSPVAEIVAPKKTETTQTSSAKLAEDKVVASKVVSAKDAALKLAAEKNAALEKHKAELAAKKAALLKSNDNRTQNKSGDTPAKKSVNDTPAPVADAVVDARISIVCKEGVQVFVDGSQKGKMSSDSMLINVKPGKHKVILTHPSFGVYSEEVDTDPGKTDRVKPKVCN